MEFSENSIKKLIDHHSINIINDETFDQVLNFSISQICQDSTVKTLPQVDESKLDAVKNACAGIMSLFIEAARQDLEKEKLFPSLNNSELNKERVEKLSDAFGKNKERFQHKLEIIGGGLPHLVDVNWRLDYCIKTNSTDLIGTPLYIVNLKTTKHGDTKFLKFTCTLQQLQELVHKLKDAARHIEKLSI